MSARISWRASPCSSAVAEANSANVTAIWSSKGAEIPLERAPLVGARQRHLPRPVVQVDHELVERLEIACHAELHDVPGPVGGLAEPVDLLVRPTETGVELTTATVMGGHRETRSTSTRPRTRGPDADPAHPVDSFGTGSSR